MLSVAVRPVETACEEHMVKGSSCSDEHVQLVPVPDCLGVSRRLCAMAGFGLEERVGDAQPSVGAELQQSLAIAIHLADTEVSRQSSWSHMSCSQNRSWR